MAYNRLLSLFFISVLLFSCTTETNENEKESTEISNNNNNTVITGNAYVVTRELDKNEDVIAEFNLLNESLGKYYIVNYNPDLHKESQVLLAQKPLEKKLFDDGNYIIVQHTVNDYAKWEKKFLLFESTRNSFEIETIGIVAYHNEPNNVMVISSYTNFGLVSEYGRMITEAKAMEDAGVTSSPEILLMTK
jgi:hypothetical protein